MPIRITSDSEFEPYRKRNVNLYDLAFLMNGYHPSIELGADTPKEVKAMLDKFSNISRGYILYHSTFDKTLTTVQKNDPILRLKNHWHDFDAVKAFCEKHSMGRSHFTHPELWQESPLVSNSAKSKSDPSLATKRGKEKLYKQKYQRFAKNLPKGATRQDITPAQLKKCLEASGLDNHPADRSIRKWFSEVTGIKGKSGRRKK